MDTRTYRAAICAAMISASAFMAPSQVALAAEADETAAAAAAPASSEASAALAEDIPTEANDWGLGIPPINEAPTNVVPVEEATPEELTPVEPIKPPPTPEELAAMEKAEQEAREKAEREAEAARIKAEQEAAAKAAKEEARAQARADAEAADEAIRSGKSPNAAAEEAASAPAEEGVASTENAPAEGNEGTVAEPPKDNAGTAATTTTESATDKWAKLRPEEKRIAAWIDSLEGRTIVDVEIEGATGERVDMAKKAIQMRAGDTFSRSAIENDRNAIYDVGYFYDIFPTFSVLPEGVVVTYHLLENPILKSVSIKGNTVIPTEELEKIVTVESGKMLNTRTLHENLQGISNRYHEDGYILVKVNNLDIAQDGALTIDINEGTLEDYKVKGNTKTKDYVVLREMRMEKGEPFNAKKARRSMQRVYNLGFFEDVNMKLNPGVEPNAVVLEIDVVEKRTGTFTVGAGYSSQDGVIGMVGVGDTNLFGTGDAINFTYEFSGDDSDAHGYVLSYKKPWLDRHETGALFRIYNRTYEYDDYDTNGDEIEEYMRKYSGGEITLSRPVSEYSTNYITLRNRRDRYISHEEDLDRSGPNYAEWRDYNFGTTRSITLQHVTDTRDNVFNPMTGNRFSLQSEFGGFGGDFNFQKASVEENYYIKAGHAQVFALRGVYGRGFGHVTESNQYRIGGQTTLRGYRDEQFRGNNAFFGTLEYRFPVVSKVQGALFTDYGGTWMTGWSPDDMYASVGFGLSVQTPVGPIRVDLAHGQQGNRVHFSVGGTF
ncbi:MAG: outer membrane protein assembly factor [Selenomonadaceae bacterium]